eukprot:10767400-Lingulodinium_polyedra.AAC.1
MAAPVREDVQLLRKVAQYLVDSPRVQYRYDWEPEAEGNLAIFVDTDFAGCAASRRSTSGGCAMRGGHLLKHWSCTQKTVTLSSGEAELGGVVKGVGEGFGLQALALDLGI